MKLITTTILVSLLAACGNSQPATKPQTDEQYVDAMAKEHKDDKPVANEMSQGNDEVSVTGDNVDYATIDGKAVTGYYVSPTGVTDAPAVIMIHEWWGLNDNIKAMADKLAAQGYNVLAVDLYRGVSATTPDEAKKAMMATMEKPALAQDNLKQALAFLEGKGATKIGVIGWCFGGGWSLQTGMLAPDKIDAVVMYYGHVEVDKTKLSTLKMPLLGMFGGADQGIPIADVKAFEKALAEVGANAEIKIYPGAGHAFANPSGTTYLKEAAEDSWAKTLAFFKAHL